MTIVIIIFMLYCFSKFSKSMDFLQSMLIFTFLLTLSPHFLPRQHGNIHMSLSAFRIQSRKVIIQDNFLKRYLAHPFFQVFHNENGDGSTMDQQRPVRAELLSCSNLIICIEVHAKRSSAKQSDTSARTCSQERMNHITMFFSLKNRRQFLLF